MNTAAIPYSAVNQNEKRIRRPRLPSNLGDRIFFGILTAAALVAPALLVMFVTVLMYGAWPSIRTFGITFLTSSVWEPNPAREKYGALPFITGTLISSFLALAIAAPVG